MKSVLITYDQALHELVLEALGRSLCKGYTLFPSIAGRGSVPGEPHLGTHAWPSTNQALLTVCDEDRVQPLLERLHIIDLENPLLGLRAFVWNIEQTI